MRKLLLTSAALSLLALPALAQTSTSTGEAVSEQAASINQQFASSPAHTSIETVPGLGTQIVTPTATCTIPIGIQGVFMGGGLGAATAFTVEYCKDLEISRQLTNEGDQADALMTLCFLPEFRKVRALQGPAKACPPEFGPDGLTDAQRKEVDVKWEEQHLLAMPKPVTPVCHERFIPPSNIDGAGYMTKVCN